MIAVAPLDMPWPVRPTYACQPATSAVSLRAGLPGCYDATEFYVRLSSHVE
jgi:hypothetical protein